MTKNINDHPHGLVFNIQRFSIHDGPGIRTTVFLKGCPITCAWCSNPEAIHPYTEIITRDVKCICCGQCVSACPNNAIEMTTEGRIIHFDQCNNCMQCIQVCTARAIERVGEEKNINEVMAIVTRDMSYYQRTGGGLTISGGEPLLQWGFSRGLARVASKTGIHVALDTTGFASWNTLVKVLEFTDLVLYDIKHLDDEQHRKLTGVSNKTILENLQKILMETKMGVWIRIPIIPGYNDSTETLGRIGAFLTELPRSIDKVSLLPFHQNGSTKYKALGRPYSLLDQQPPSKESMEKIKRSFEKLDLKTEIGR